MNLFQLPVSYPGKPKTVFLLAPTPFFVQLGI
uniref:Uncharacterized protein n=1 Tax=Arundo donax TaxID=35708 RepID=A0A0A9AU67_ARUDO